MTQNTLPQTIVTIELYNRSLSFVADIGRIVSADIAKAVNVGGTCVIVQPAEITEVLVPRLGIRLNQLRRELIDYWLAVWVEQLGMRRLLFDTLWCIRRVVKSKRGQSQTYSLTALSADRHLLLSRWVLYTSGSIQAKKTDQGDDMMKAVVNDNFIAATSSTRNLSSRLFGKAADTSAAPTIDKSFAWDDVPEALKDIADTCASHDTTPMRLYWDIEANLSATPIFLFRTYTDQRGLDRTATVEFSESRGNLIDTDLDEDWTNEWNHVTASGQGEGADRRTATAEAVARSGRGPLSRRERVKSATFIEFDDTDGLQDEANAVLEEGRPRSLFTGTAINTPQAIFGKDWNLGDIVTAVSDGEVFTPEIEAVEITIQGAQVNVTARLSDVQ